MVTVAVDAMGGDDAPRVEIEGCLLALREPGSTGCQRADLNIILVGNPESIRAELARQGGASPRLSIEPADAVITMHDSPVAVIKEKKDSSLATAARLVADGKAEALITAGNTGASMVAAKVHFGVTEGIERPAIAAVFPTKQDKPVVVLDMGANVDCKPDHLAQFGLMGSCYSQGVFNVSRPAVGLLNIGEEDSKGNEQTKAAHKLLRRAPINFIGNIEGRDIIAGDVDVVVCDGFVGNIVLKFGESVGTMILAMLKNEIKSSIWYTAGALLISPALRRLKKKVDYSEYGGAPLLGLNHVCIICHGSSNSRAIKNAVLLASDYVKNEINQKLKTLATATISEGQS